MSSANQIKAQYAYNKKNLLYLAGVSEDDYGKFQMDTAIEWLEKYWHGVINTDALLNTKLFWNWFTCVWSEADDRFIVNQLYTTPKPSRWCLYRQLHQYVFDDNDRFQIIMHKDFRAMQKEFLREMKKPELYTQPLQVRSIYCNAPVKTITRFKHD
jgi:hypothetical protein